MHDGAGAAALGVEHTDRARVEIQVLDQEQAGLVEAEPGALERGDESARAVARRRRQAPDGLDSPRILTAELLDTIIADESLTPLRLVAAELLDERLHDLRWEA